MMQREEQESVKVPLYRIEQEQYFYLSLALLANLDPLNLKSFLEARVRQIRSKLLHSYGAGVRILYATYPNVRH